MNSNLVASRVVYVVQRIGISHIYYIIPKGPSSIENGVYVIEKFLLKTQVSEKVLAL